MNRPFQDMWPVQVEYSSSVWQTAKPLLLTACRNSHHAMKINSIVLLHTPVRKNIFSKCPKMLGLSAV